MDDLFTAFERIARKAHGVAYVDEPGSVLDHPFESRNIHPCLPATVRQLFDDSYYSQAAFEAFKYVDKEVARLASSQDMGGKLMMSAFNENRPPIQLNALSNVSEKDEQMGYKHLFAGSIWAVRNPRGHEYAVHDSIDECLDHLSLASLLLRKLENAGFNLT